MNFDPNDKPPVEPTADIRAAARQLHEVYVALTNTGFSERQSLTIVGHILSVHAAGGPQ